MMQVAKDGEDMRKVVDLILNLHARGSVLPDIFVEKNIREWPSVTMFITPFFNMQHPDVRHPTTQPHAFTQSITLVLTSCVPHVVHFVTTCFP